ncbi:MAG: phospholipase D-like domain-containing protein, partial [Anaerolineae bacterium]
MIFLRRNFAHILLIVTAAWVLTACGPTNTAPPSTLEGFTQVPSGATTVPPTATTRPPSATPRPATATPLPPTATTRPATATPRPPTATSRPATTVPTTSSGVVTAQLPQGFVAQKGFWQVYFTAPTGSRDESTYTGGIDEMLAASIGQARQTLDIVAYEFNLPSVTQAVLAANARGVRVRVVTDNNDGLGDAETTLHQLVDAGIPVVPDTRSALMHDKFMIIDSTIVWMGTWNYTINDTYRNNNTALVLRSRNVVADYQAEFNEMFEQGQFGPRSPINTPNVTFTQDG